MTLHHYRSRQVHETLNRVNPSSDFRDRCSAKSGTNLWQFDKFLAHGQVPLGQMDKWLWQCTTTGLDNFTENWMEKICQAVSEIWVLQVWQPPSLPAIHPPTRLPGPWLQSKVKVIAQGHKVGLIPYRLISLSFHVDRPLQWMKPSAWSPSINLSWPCNAICHYWFRQWLVSCYLTQWGQGKHICISKLTIIGWDIGLLPGLNVLMVPGHCPKSLMCYVWAAKRWGKKSVMIHYVHIILSIDPGLRGLEILPTSKYRNLNSFSFL